MSEDGRSALKGGKKNVKTGRFELEIKEPDCAKEAEMACPAEIINLLKN
jgi:ferredoxin